MTEKVTLKKLSPSIPDCPAAGAGVHPWKMTAANICRLRGMTQAEAVCFIDERSTRPPTPANETVSTVAKAYNSTAGTYHTSGFSHAGDWKWSVPIGKIAFDPDKLKTVAGRIPQPRNWRHWLFEKSPKRPETQNPLSFLAHLFADGEQVHIFDKMETGVPLATLAISHPMDCRTPDIIRTGGADGAGVWFLCNPVDGEFHPNPREAGKVSCRALESLTAFRYAVLESDTAPASEWLAFIAQLPVRVAAIYTSGSRSIHTLLRLNATSKAEWDAAISPIKRPLKMLGADAACLSAVRLTRLPGCQRPNKGGFQRLLYLNPNPPEARLVDLPVLFNRQTLLERWRKLCPRWNKQAEAFE